jgi:hypothetical protein
MTCLRLSGGTSALNYTFPERFTSSSSKSVHDTAPIGALEKRWKGLLTEKLPAAQRITRAADRTGYGDGRTFNSRNYAYPCRMPSTTAEATCADNTAPIGAPARRSERLVTERQANAEETCGLFAALVW